MISIKRQLSRSGLLAAAVALAVGTVLPLFSPADKAAAAGLFTPRKMAMTSQSSGNTTADVNNVAYAAGAGGNGAKATYTFNFTQATSGASIQSVAIQFCTTPFIGTQCVGPTGFDASNVTVATASNFVTTQPTLDTTTVANTGIFTAGGGSCGTTSPYRTNCILLKLASPTVETGTPAFQIIAGNNSTGTSWIKNPTSAGTFYARISTFSDLYTTAVDQGAVTGSVQNTIDITSRVQEQLNFSIGNAWVAAGATCAALNNTGALNLGNASNNYTLDPSTAYEATSYWRLSTNANNGSTVQYSGDTLKTASGTAITPLTTTATASTTGTEQFGLGLNSGDSNQSLGNATWATAPYNAANGTITTGGTAKFAFDTTSVSSPKAMYTVPSANTVTCDTGSVRYLANISTTTKPGLYQTSIAYIATPTY